MTLSAISFTIEFLCVVILFALVMRYRKLVKSLSEDVKTYKTVAESAERLYDEERRKGVLVQAEYFTSESDINKYSSDAKMKSAIKGRMAMLIGNDLLKKFEPSVIPLKDGKQKYRLMLKVEKI